MAVTVFSFPPDKGNVGTAAYLNVFGSIYRVLKVTLRLSNPFQLSSTLQRYSAEHRRPLQYSCLYSLRAHCCEALVRTQAMPPLSADKDSGTSTLQ